MGEGRVEERNVCQRLKKIRSQTYVSIILIPTIFVLFISSHPISVLGSATFPSLATAPWRKCVPPPHTTRLTSVCPTLSRTSLLITLPNRTTDRVKYPVIDRTGSSFFPRISRVLLSPHQPHVRRTSIRVDLCGDYRRKNIDRSKGSCHGVIERVWETARIIRCRWTVGSAELELLILSIVAYSYVLLSLSIFVVFV